MMDVNRVRDRLVLAALPHVAFDGWTLAALAEAARDEGLDADLPSRVFPGGAVEAVEWFVGLADRLMTEDAAACDLAALRVPDRIAALVMARLARWAPHREAIRRAMAALALPHHLGLAARLTFASADAIWRAAGDRSSDFSWYTRRASLAAVYGATLLYWLDDRSEGAADTRAFLARRLGDVGRITKARRRFEGMLDCVPLPGRLAKAPRRGGAITRSAPPR